MRCKGASGCVSVDSKHSDSLVFEKRNCPDMSHRYARDCNAKAIESIYNQCPVHIWLIYAINTIIYRDLQNLRQIVHIFPENQQNLTRFLKWITIGLRYLDMNFI
jgi:hypothetical protein